jgi:hypothetical protein
MIWLLLALDLMQESAIAVCMVYSRFWNGPSMVWSKSQARQSGRDVSLANGNMMIKCKNRLDETNPQTLLRFLCLIRGTLLSVVEFRPSECCCLMVRTSLYSSSYAESGLLLPQLQQLFSRYLDIL